MCLTILQKKMNFPLFILYIISVDIILVHEWRWHSYH